ncbi:hypothetical protein C8Q72DRAFT_166621 [Fomitopsis betulina]|nr:hypothetical protein C8Q72DRAFT_166621 [Fomitopsis betulina]
MFPLQKKIKCDTARPTCHNCVRVNAFDDCIYGEDAEFPTIRLLEDKIGQLQQRITFLQNNADSQPVVLRDPYATRNQAPLALEQKCHGLPPAIAQELTRSFCSHATDFGFFLHLPRFQEQTVLPHITLSHHALALITATRLVGAYLSTDSNAQELQHKLLTHTLKDLSAALAELEPAGMLNLLQTEILLAHYFFSTNRTFEAIYHMDAASAIVLANGYHRVRSTRAPPRLESRDDIEEGERINAFWNTFILDRCWSPVLGRTPILSDEETKGTGIDTPWPLNIESYENHPLPVEWRGLRTVQKFVQDSHFLNMERSPLALHAKAAALYSEARRVASQFRTYTLPAGWAELDKRLGQFIHELPAIDGLQQTIQQGTPDRRLLVVHMLARSAVIELHDPLECNGFGAGKAFPFALDAVQVMNQAVDACTGGAFVDSMVGVVLMSVAGVLVRTLRQNSAVSGYGDEGALITALGQIRLALESWGRRSAFIRGQYVCAMGLLEGLSA